VNARHYPLTMRFFDDAGDVVLTIEAANRESVLIIPDIRHVVADLQERYGTITVQITYADESVETWPPAP
jgi:hypothetical protein